jgi:hypothetical protein
VIIPILAMVGWTLKGMLFPLKISNPSDAVIINRRIVVMPRRITNDLPVDTPKIPWTIPTVIEIPAIMGWNLKGILTPLKIISPIEAVIINRRRVVIPI